MLRYADSTDDASGHGTHVSGILAGAPLGAVGDLASVQGIASAAKLAFFDLGSDAMNGYITLPGDLYSR